jgi:predicted SAM-dependent methyltransferase
MLRQRRSGADVVDANAPTEPRLTDESILARQDQPAASFDALAHPRRLNLGCGFDYRRGFLNVDLNAFHKPDLVADVRDLRELPTGYYDELVAEDVLEHLGRTETQSTLLEWSRVLRLGGVIRLRVPDLRGLLALIADPARQSIEEQERLVRSLFGTQNYTGDYHQTGFTEVLLRHFLEEAGFSDLQITGRDGWLFEVQGTKRRAPTPVTAPAVVALADSAYRVEWLATEVPASVDANTSMQCRVEARNAGDATWRSTDIFVSYHWLDGRRTIVWDGVRTPLPYDIGPGSLAALSVDVNAPDHGGELTLEFTLVHENVAWFEQRGAATLGIPVHVRSKGGA